MKATITQIRRVRERDLAMHVHFQFTLGDSTGVLLTDVVSPAHAAVVARHNAPSSALFRLMHAIANAEMPDYESLVGRTFDD
jgi:hypothetical protein